MSDGGAGGIDTDLKELLTWKELAIRRWRERAKGCPGRSEVITNCDVTKNTCCYSNCIFRYWMEGI